jgi:hypothetical protein
LPTPEEEKEKDDKRKDRRETLKKNSGGTLRNLFNWSSSKPKLSLNGESSSQSLSSISSTDSPLSTDSEKEKEKEKDKEREKDKGSDNESDKEKEKEKDIPRLRGTRGGSGIRLRNGSNTNSSPLPLGPTKSLSLYNNLVPSTSLPSVSRTSFSSSPGSTPPTSHSSSETALTSSSETPLLNPNLSSSIISEPSAPIVVRRISNPLQPSATQLYSIELLSFPAEVLAESLTLSETELFRQVHPSTCLNPEAITYPSPAQSLITRFNSVSNWVAHEIVTTPNFKMRTALLKLFIGIAEHCRKINSFNTLLEIIAGLNLSCVQRLKRTWKVHISASSFLFLFHCPFHFVLFVLTLTFSSLSVSLRTVTPPSLSLSLFQGIRRQKKVFESLEVLMASSYNYNAYRVALREAQPPCLPYFGVFLRDFTFIDVGNPTFIKENFVNVEKLKMLGSVAHDIERFQQVEYPSDSELAAVGQLLDENILKVGRVDADRLHHFSNLCEPSIADV